MSSLRWRVRGAHVILCSCCWLTLSVPASASALTLTEAIELANARNVAVSASAAETEATRLRAAIEALRPNDVIESDFENFAGTDNLSGVDALEATVRYSRTFELGNKQALRRELGVAELKGLQSTQQLRRVDLAAEVARRFIHVVSDQEHLEATRRAAGLARTSRDVVRERVAAGASSPAALSRAEISLARAHIEEEHAEHELASSRVKLAALWNERQPSFDAALGNLFTLPEIDTLEAYQAQLDTSPDLSRFVSEAGLQQARMRIAAARSAPDLSVSAGIRRLEAFDDQAFIASFSLPVGTRQRAQLEQRLVRADMERTERERGARLLELHATLYDLYQEIQHARTETQTLNSIIRPQATAMLQTTTEGYRAGRFSLLELTDAQTQLLEVERDAIRAAAEFHTLFIEIQRLVGAPMRALGSGVSP